MYCTCFAIDIGDGEREKAALPWTEVVPRPSYLGDAILLVSESERSESGNLFMAGVREYLYEGVGVFESREVDIARKGNRACALKIITGYIQVRKTRRRGNYHGRNIAWTGSKE